MSQTRGPSASGQQVDPVCGMNVDPAQAAGKSEFKGREYYFCSMSCKQKFDAEPGRYAGK